jgi:hypothetical protein
MLITERNDSHAVISTPVSHRLVTAAIGPGTSRHALPCLPCVDDVDGRGSPDRFARGYGGLPGLVPGATSTSKSLHR